MIDAYLEQNLLHRRPMIKQKDFGLFAFFVCDHSVILKNIHSFYFIDANKHLSMVIVRYKYRVYDKFISEKI